VTSPISRLEEALLARPWLSVEPADWSEFRRAGELGPRSLHHRQVKIPDPLTPGCSQRPTVVHYDSDYEIIASVTGRHRCRPTNGSRLVPKQKVAFEPSLPTFLPIGVAICPDSWYPVDHEML
jgi:hypothetical protein